MNSPETTPVLIGIGEHLDRPASPEQALEPLAAMAEALRAADADAGGGWLARLESLALVGFVTWRYDNPVGQLCRRLGVAPAQQVNASMGGETPVRLIHEAALRIARGELTVAAIVGGEAMNARARARKAQQQLPWTPLPTREASTRFPSSRFALSPVAQQLGMSEPARIYPLYEMATQAAWGQTPAQAQAESATLWARYAEVAAHNPSAWIRHAPDAATIAEVGDDNRLIAWPYPKLMVANPQVNQSAAVIVTSLAAARAAGVPDERCIHIWGGAHAVEPEDYLLRDRYDHSTAQTAVLQRAVALVGGDARRFDRLELYSCFPVVPKMALRVLGLRADERAPTVTGGLTFFGGPLNNYMTHAVCAMVRTLRDAPDEVGLLYGQGGYVNKHHALVVSRRVPPAPLAPDASVQAAADAARGPVPPLLDTYRGPASVETGTVLYARDGLPLHGVVVLRTPDGSRLMAKVPADDTATLALLQANDRSPVGLPGQVRIDVFGHPVWTAGEAASERGRGPRSHCRVERDGPLTLVTLDRPAAMNCLHTPAHIELAEVFDDFEADPSQWVAILTGAGDRAFCAGNDLKYTARAMARGEPLGLPLSGFGGLTGRFERVKPVIAAVNGVALGGGFELALASDIVVASDTATFALPEPKVGLAALAGGLLRLPRQIGLKPAMGLILTGRQVGAQEGQALGFVNEVVPAADLLAAARRWADQILACSPMSVRASIEIAHRGLDAPTLAEASTAQLHYPQVRALLRSDDFREGPRAFAEKRPPRWTGQ